MVPEYEDHGSYEEEKAEENDNSDGGGMGEGADAEEV